LQIRCIMQAMLRDISLTTSPNACAKIGSVSDHSGPSLVASPVSLFHSRRLQQTATADRDAGDRSEAITAVRSRGKRIAWLYGGLQHACPRKERLAFGPLEAGAASPDNAKPAGFASSILPACARCTCHCRIVAPNRIRLNSISELGSWRDGPQGN